MVLYKYDYLLLLLTVTKH